MSSPAPTTNFDKCHLPDDKEHPDSVISFIQSCDTIFFGTTSADDEIRFSSHVGMNVCGGRPGFIHIQPSDKRTLILPDFSGNGIMTSLGNVETMLSLSRVSFATDIYSYEMLRLVQQCPGTMVQHSPYSLPVRYSDKESAPVLWFGDSSRATATQKHCLPQLDHCHVYLGILSRTGHHIQPSRHPRLLTDS